MSGPLSNLRVLELADEKGQFCGKLMADLGSDVVNDMSYRPYPKVRLPVHEIALVAMGLRLIDNAHLERLAEACAERNRWEFCFTLNPLRLERGTGSPANPIATL